MLVFVSGHIPWNYMSNLKLRWSDTALRDESVQLSAMTLGNICQREYALTVDEIRKQLQPEDIHQQETFPYGRNGCVRVDALRQSS